MSGSAPGAGCVCSQLQPWDPRATPSGTRGEVARWDPRLGESPSPGGRSPCAAPRPRDPFSPSCASGSVAALRPSSAGAGVRKRPGPAGLFPGACSAPGGGGGCVWFGAVEAKSKPPPRGRGPGAASAGRARPRCLCPRLLSGPALTPPRLRALLAVARPPCRCLSALSPRTGLTCAWAPSPRPCRRSLGRTRTWERRPSARLSPGARKSAPQEDEEVPGPTLMPWPWPCLGNRKVGEGWGRGEHCFLAWEGELVG